MKRIFFVLLLLCFSLGAFAQNHLLYCLRSLNKVSESNGFFYSHIGESVYLFDSEYTAVAPLVDGVFRFGQMEVQVKGSKDSLSVFRLLKPSLDFIKESKPLASDRDSSEAMLSYLKIEMEKVLSKSESDLGRGEMPQQSHQKTVFFCQQAFDKNFFFLDFGPRVNKLQYEIFEASKRFKKK